MINEKAWAPIGQYRNIPLPIRPLPPMPKRLDLKKVLRGLKPQIESRVDGTLISKTIQ